MARLAQIDLAQGMAIHETEFTEYVQDFLENFSEKGVAETDEIVTFSFGASGRV